MPVVYDDGLVSLADVRAHLNFDDDDTSADGELVGFINAATPIIEHACGPIESTHYVESYDGGGSFLILRHRPILAITSVTEYRGASSYLLTQVSVPSLGTAYSFTVDPEIGQVVRRSTGGGEVWFPPGTGKVIVDYTAGRPSTPSNVRLATLELIRHWYQQTQLGGRPGFSESSPFDDGPTQFILGFSVPNRVVEMLTPSRRGPAVA